MRTNLDLEHVSSDAKEIRSARKSALDVIAVIGGIPPEETEPKQTKANGQRKKGGKNKGRKKKKKKEAQGPPSNCEKVLSLCDALMFEAAELASAAAGIGGAGAATAEAAAAIADAKREAEAARVRTQCAIVLAYGALCDAILEDSRKKRKSAGTAISDCVGEHVMPSLDPAGQLIMFPDWRIAQVCQGDATVEGISASALDQ